MESVRSKHKMLLWIGILIIGLVMFLGILSIISRKTPSIGMVDGRLKPCGNKPNCVCSEDRDAASYIKPISFTGSAESQWNKAKEIINDMGGNIVKEDDYYLWTTFTTKLFRFIDDLELRLDKENGLIHIRSCSRVGYSDMRVNRRRTEKLRFLFNQSQ